MCCSLNRRRTGCRTTKRWAQRPGTSGRLSAQCFWGIRRIKPPPGRIMPGQSLEVEGWEAWLAAHPDRAAELVSPGGGISGAGTGVEGGLAGQRARNAGRRRRVSADRAVPDVRRPRTALAGRGRLAGGDRGTARGGTDGTARPDRGRAAHSAGSRRTDDREIPGALRHARSLFGGGGDSVGAASAGGRRAADPGRRRVPGGPCGLRVQRAGAEGSADHAYGRGLSGAGDLRHGARQSAGGDFLRDAPRPASGCGWRCWRWRRGRAAPSPAAAGTARRRP